MRRRQRQARFGLCYWERGHLMPWEVSARYVPIRMYVALHPTVPEYAGAMRRGDCIAYIGWPSTSKTGWFDNASTFINRDHRSH